MLGRPEPRLGDVYAVCLPAGDRPSTAADDFDFRCGRVRFDSHLKTPHAVRVVGRGDQALYTAGWDAFDPDGLPDAGLGGVPDAAPVDPLLAARVPAGVAGVGDLDDEFDVAADGCQVRGDGQIAADVVGHLRAVGVDDDLLVDRAEMQQEATAVGTGWQGLPADHAPIPEGLVRLQAAVDPRQGRLRGEGHEDRPVIGRGRVPVRDGAVPGPVQVEPAFSNQLRPWVFR